MSPTSIAAYIVLFGSVGLLFLLVSLVLGRLVRPKLPNPAKVDAYECGEPAVGSSFVQFDLRFYVVALVFIVFEVEVALFFPPATIFGTATRWMSPSPNVSGRLDAKLGATVEEKSMTAPAAEKAESRKEPESKKLAEGTKETGQEEKTESQRKAEEEAAERKRIAEEPGDARALALAAAADLAAFFALILLGFAYVWRRGDLNWVRAFDTSPIAARQGTPLSVLNCRVGFSPPP